MVRKCSAGAEINNFRGLFSLAEACAGVPLKIHFMGKLHSECTSANEALLSLDRRLQMCVYVCVRFRQSQEEELERLEREFAIQSQITEAARRLASDPHVSSKKLKKQRKTSYLNALKKLQEIENSINEYRVRSGKKPTQRASLIIEGTGFPPLRIRLPIGIGNTFSATYCVIILTQHAGLLNVLTCVLGFFTHFVISE